MATQIVPGAVRIDTISYPLFVPQPVIDNPNAEEVFEFLVIAWVFTAWLSKRFPKADVTDCAMLAGMAAWKSTKELLKLMPKANKMYPGHPKAKQNLEMLRSIDDNFTRKSDVSKEIFAEVKAYNEQASLEVEKLFPCTCGECLADRSNLH